MPVQIIATEGLFTTAAEEKLFADLTELLLELNGLSDSAFMRPNVIGEITSVNNGRTFSGGKPANIVIFELKVPSIVLPTRDLQLAWISRGTDLILAAAAGKITKDRIWGNVVHAVDGLWGINGHAYSNEDLGAVLSGQRAAF
ncbi:hypothetical protein [Kiloniella laminariae]|uniref:hypothetical protein n=1 Tax=Kiloniella laminariae TaxID=454162 RepID=UPI00037BC79A|nr:hypothetical protein [Kiloniella laminariae]